MKSRDYHKISKFRLSSIVIVTAVISMMIFSMSLEEKEYEIKSVGANACDIEATLYENANYTGTGVDLTTAGITVSGWEPGVSKYLEINVSVEQGATKTHIVEVNMPRQMYVVSKDIDYLIPGFKSVDFEHNGSMNINGNAQVYTYHENSGKLTYVLDMSDTSIVTEATIQLEIKYDEAFWDKQTGSSIVEDGINPIEVKLKQDGANTYEKEIKIKKITAGEELYRSMYFDWTYDMATYTQTRTKFLYCYVKNGADLNERVYFKEVVTDIQMPYWTDDSGKKHYLELDVGSIQYPFPDKGNFKYTYDKNAGTLKLSMENFYETGRGFNTLKMHLTVPGDVLALGYDSVDFAGGKIKVTATNIHNEEITIMGEKSIESTKYILKEDIDEDVNMFNGYDDVYYYDKFNEEAMLFLADMGIGNEGQLDSVAKQITYTMADELLVAYMKLYAYKGDEKYEVEYSLKDKNGNQVYFDSSGNVVKNGTAGATDTWKIVMDNPRYQYVYGSAYFYLSRADLPQSQRNYYFKSVKYTFGSIEAISNYSAEFYGYLGDGVKLNEYYSLGGTLESVGNSKYRTFSSYRYVRMVDFRDTHGYIEIEEPEAEVIQAGSSFDLTGRAFVSYSTGTTSNLMDEVRIGVLLPEGISISKENIKLTNYEGENVELDSLTKQPYIQGKNMWIIDVDPEYYIGYYKEDLEETSSFLNPVSHSSSINFTITFETSNSMTSANINTDEMFYFTAKELQAYRWAYNYYKEDPWDLNENGDTTDYLLKSSDSILISVVTDALSINVEDYISITGKGSVSDKVAYIEKKNDMVTYTTKVNNLKAGTLKLYDQYISIPKRNSIKDKYLIQDAGAEGFDLELASAIRFEGTDIFEAFYSVEPCMDFIGLKDLDTSKWYREADLLATYTWADVTAVKISLKNNRYVYSDFNTNINLDMMINKNEVAILEGQMNKWASRVNYVFAYGSNNVGGYVNTLGCKAQVTEGLEDDIKDAGRLLKDIINAEKFDDTPKTGDMIADDIRKWIICLIILSLAIIKVCVQWSKKGIKY